jgi:hypothetical protein
MRVPNLVLMSLTVAWLLVSAPGSPALNNDTCRAGDPSCDVSNGGPAQNYDPTPPEWAPQGTVVADSGFAAFRDSFQFFNYGQRLGNGNALLGYNANEFAAQLTPDSMLRMLGPDVACTHYSQDDTGKEVCIPKPAVAEWIDAANNYMWGGHCYGVAALNAQLFNGDLVRSRLTDAQINSAVQLDSKMQGELAYWWTTQLTTNAAEGTLTDPLSVVQTLRDNLQPGNLPYVLVLSFKVEGQQAGHAITPTAVYERANGDFDIAVYDNNFPLRTRAIHVDTSENSYDYLVLTIPGGPQVSSIGDANNLTIGLVPLTDIQGTLDCPFCAGQEQIVAFGSRQPIPASVNTKIRALDGSEIPNLKQHPNLNPYSGSLPAYRMPPGTDFKVTVDNSTNDQPLNLFSNTFLGDGTVLDSAPLVPAGATMTLEVRAAQRSISVSSDKPTVTRYLQAAVERQADDYNAWFVADWKDKGSASAPFRLTEEDGVAEYSVGGTDAVRVHVIAQRIRSTGTVPAAHTASSVLVRPGNKLRVDITKWTGDGGVPELVLERANGSSRNVTMDRGLGPKANVVDPKPAL